MRALVIALALLSIGSALPTGHAAGIVYEANGSYLLGEVGPGLHKPDTPGIAITACDDLLRDFNNVVSSCYSFGGAAVGGLLATADAGGNPTVQGMQVCFYSGYGLLLDCPVDQACEGASWCGTVPAGSRLYAIQSASGVGVAWHLTVA